MEVNIGARVVTKEGHVAGIVDRVVIEPDTNELLSIVVHRGLAPARDLVVPLTEVEHATRDRVYLRVSTADLQTMPDFIESEYAHPPHHRIPPSIYPPTQVLVPLPRAADLAQPTVGEAPRRPLPPAKAPRYAPPESIDISEGTDVYCVDGRLGTVDEVITDSRTNRVTSFVVRKGRWFTKDVVVPVTLVADADRHRINLACRKDEMNKLPGP